MDDVIATSFSSTLGLEQMHAVLSARFTRMNWRMGESHYEGDYVKGATPDKISVRILEEAGRFCVETYFPLSQDATPLLSDAAKREFLLWLEQQLLVAIGAAELRPA
jgi:hypothetical protein